MRSVLSASRDFDQLHAAHSIVIKSERLCVIGVNGDRLALAIRVDGVPRDALQFSHYHCAGDPGQDDLACGVRILEPLEDSVPPAAPHTAHWRT